MPGKQTQTTQTMQMQREKISEKRKHKSEMKQSDTIFDPPCVKVIRGHLRSSEVTDLGWPLMTFSPKIKIRVILTVLSHFDNDSLAFVGFIASARSPSQLTKFGCLAWPEATGWPRIIKLDTIGFLSLRATRSFFREAVGPSGAERLGGSNS